MGGPDYRPKLSLPNYRGLKITTNDLFLQILPVLRHIQYQARTQKLLEGGLAPTGNFPEKIAIAFMKLLFGGL